MSKLSKRILTLASHIEQEIYKAAPENTSVRWAYDYKHSPKESVGVVFNDSGHEDVCRLTSWHREQGWGLQAFNGPIADCITRAAIIIATMFAE